LSIYLVFNFFYTNTGVFTVRATNKSKAALAETTETIFIFFFNKQIDQVQYGRIMLPSSNFFILLQQVEWSP